VNPRRLRRADLPEDTVALGAWLLGRDVVRFVGGDTMIGRIVETEVYLPDDPASHSFAGATQRNRSMFLDRGHAYVYRIYGMWHCLNVAAGAQHIGAAVLIRALQPLGGVEAMRERRSGAADRDLLRGPGRLCVALEIDLSLDGLDLCNDERLWLSEGVAFADSPACSGRIGVSKAADKKLRFYIPKNAFVSGSGTKR
jgi:DNA-3-methyladenine glycosylase